jgi:hypothetical protein
MQMEQFAMLPEEAQATTEAAPSLPNKYGYPEFAGWNGERYLKKLLRQILPMALYRTWEIFTDHQAVGNVCYLSVPRLAEIAGRSPRTIEKNLASLCAKHLLVERAERKVFRSSTGIVTSRVVIIKDFAGLYALAHEYHEWLNAEEYLAPDREMLALLHESPNLVAKLRRFENYRKVLYNRLPGPFSQVREKDRWFTDYQAELSFTPAEHEQAKEVKQPQSVALPAKDSTTSLAQDLARSSGQRITRTTPINRSEGDSFDSAPTVPSEDPLQDGESSQILDGHQSAPSLALNTYRRKKQETCVSMSLTPPPSVQKGAPSSARRKQERPEASRAVTPARQGEARADIEQKHHSWPGNHGLAAPSHLLAESFVREIVAPFGDLNPKGTQTHILSILKEAHLAQPADVLACLIRAYVVARDARTIRPEHCHPETGLVNRMPLFCALFRRFVEACVQGRRGNASWHHLEEEVAADGHLTCWWNEHRHLLGTLAPAVFTTSENKQNVSGVCSPAHAPEPAPCVSFAPVRQTCSQPLSQNGNPLTSASGRANVSPGLVPSPHRPNQYETYVNALLAKYSAQEPWQEVR